MSRTLTVEYLREGKAHCNKLDPGRLDSSAQTSKPETGEGLR